VIKTSFPPGPAKRPVLSDRLNALRLSLRRADDADVSFLQSLYASFRAEELARISWSQPQKDAFVGDQFRLQHHHFVTYFSEADFWIVERSQPSGSSSPVGRLYIDRSASLWRIIDIGFLPEMRGQGIGSALLQWAQVCATDAGAAGIDLHVLLVNEAAAKLYRRLGFRTEGKPEGYHQRMAWRA